MAIIFKEIAQYLISLANLAEDQNFVSRVQETIHILLMSLYQSDPSPSSDLYWLLHIHGTHTYTKHIHIELINNKEKNKKKE